MAAAQRTASDAYLTLTRGLLPAPDHDQIDAAALNSHMGGVAIRIVQYAPWWAPPKRTSALERELQ